jgi:methanogenic corrinoid protein MtbC1
MISEAIYLHYLDSLLSGNKKQCVQIVSNLIQNNVSMKEIYVQLFQRSMYRIGQMWEKERCTIAEEHIATKITESLLEITTSNYLNGRHSDKLAIITCIDKEFHEIGARMVTGFFEVSGWETLYLGSNTPQSSLIELIKEKKPDVVGISNNFYINISRLLKLIEQFQQVDPELQILVGGQALSGGQSDILNKFSNVRYIATLDELEEYISLHSSTI